MYVQGYKVVRDKLSFRAKVTTITALNREFVPNHSCHPVFTRDTSGARSVHLRAVVVEKAEALVCVL